MAITASREPVYVVPTTSNDLMQIMSSSSRLQLDSFSNIGSVDLDVHLENPTSNSIDVMLDGDIKFRIFLIFFR